MPTHTTPLPPKPDWGDLDRCPFCEDAIPNPGSGFIEHVREHSECHRGFNRWRETVADDMRGGWSG